MKSQPHNNEKENENENGNGNDDDDNDDDDEGDLRKEPARWRSLLLALDLGLVLYECLPPIPLSGTPIIGSNTVDSCP